jgi:hypothetical protein
MADPVRFTEADVARLGAKLDALELDDNERGLLDAIFATARGASDEVAGFAAPNWSPALGALPSQGLQQALIPVQKVGFPNLGKNAIEYV